MKPEKTDHIQGLIVHEYDGIEEADNHLPLWWLFIFFGAVGFAVLYWSYYEAWHFGEGTRELYAAEMAERLTSGGDVSDEVLTTLSNESTIVAAGRATFEANCVACHGSQGEGNIGPNLTDNVWIHGGAPMSIYTSARDGVAARGMPSWGPVLGDRGLTGVVAYVLSIRDTNVPGRAPEGDPYDPSATGTIVPATAPAAPTPAAPTPAAPTPAAPTGAPEGAATGAIAPTAAPEPPGTDAL